MLKKKFILVSGRVVQAAACYLVQNHYCVTYIWKVDYWTQSTHPPSHTIAAVSVCSSDKGSLLAGSKEPSTFLMRFYFLMDTFILPLLKPCKSSVTYAKPASLTAQMICSRIFVEASTISCGATSMRAKLLWCLTRTSVKPKAFKASSAFSI